MMATYATREELDARVRVLEGEVEGEKMVTRHILEQTHHNSNDLASLKTDMALVRAVLTSHSARLNVLTQDVGLLRQDMEVVRRDVSEMRRDMSEMRRDMGQLRQEMQQDTEQLRQEMRRGMGNLHQEMGEMRADIAAIRAAVAPPDSAAMIENDRRRYEAADQQFMSSASGLPVDRMSSAADPSPTPRFHFAGMRSH